MSEAAPKFYFVYKPRDIHFRDAKKAITDVCTCTFRSTKGSAFFARVTDGDIMAATNVTFEGGSKLSIEDSKTMNNEIWGRHGPRRPRAPGEEGEAPLPAAGSQAPRRTQPRRERPAPAHPQQPRAERPDQPRYYSLYVFSRDPAVTTVDAIYDYILNTLKQPAVQFDKFERETGNFGFVRFLSLDDSRAARSAYNESPLGEHAIVKPALPRGRRFRFGAHRGAGPDAEPAAQ